MRRLKNKQQVVASALAPAEIGPGAESAKIGSERG